MIHPAFYINLLVLFSKCIKESLQENYPLVISHSYWKWPFRADLPVKNGDFPKIHDIWV